MRLLISQLELSPQFSSSITLTVRPINSTIYWAFLKNQTNYLGIFIDPSNTTIKQVFSLLIYRWGNQSLQRICNCNKQKADTGSEPQSHTMWVRWLLMPLPSPVFSTLTHILSPPFFPHGHTLTLGMRMQFSLLCLNVWYPWVKRIKAIF